jgi:hypothetical protein
MSDRSDRQTPRVILRNARRGRFGEDEVLVLEMGLGGAKLEHGFRSEVGRVARFVCGPLDVDAVVRHSVLLPATTGVVYHSGVMFPNLTTKDHSLLLELLVHEAQQQVVEWEANVRGEEMPMPSRKGVRRSAAAPRFIVLRYRNRAWERTVSRDPNQPPDGVAVVESTPEEEIAVLRQTYERADAETREFMRRVATVAILEQMRD